MHGVHSNGLNPITAAKFYKAMHGEVVSCVNVLDLYRMFDNTLTLLIFAKYDRLKFEENLNFRQVTPT